MRIIILAVLMAFLFGCTGEEVEQCTGGPVCGVDGVTYENECAANNSFVEIAYQGKCKTCIESDSGKDAFVKGTTKADGEEYMDKCTDSVNLLEYYCVGVELKNTTITCEECSDGKCIETEKEPPRHCVDSDGKDYYTRGNVTEFDNVFVDTCVNTAVKEYYCEEGLAKSEVKECAAEFTCNEGRCVRKKQKCSDSDGGRDISKQGVLTIDALIDAEYIDKCVDDDTLREYYCVADDVFVEDIDCGQGNRCLSARCVVDTR